MANTKWINNLARLLKTKDGKYFLKFARQTDKNQKPIGENPFPLTINEGDTFQAKLKKDDLARLVNEGKMTQELADKICATVKFEFSKAPDREAKEETKPAASKPKVDNDDEIPF